MHILSIILHLSVKSYPQILYILAVTEKTIFNSLLRL